MTEINSESSNFIQKIIDNDKSYLSQLYIDELIENNNIYVYSGDEEGNKLLVSQKIDISPVVNYLSSENILIYEAKLIRPSLEDAFVKMTGIEIDLMNKEKEKRWDHLLRFGIFFPRIWKIII